MAALLLLGAAAVELGSESLTLNSFYPSPLGIYSSLTSTGDATLARDGGVVSVGQPANVQLNPANGGSITLGSGSNTCAAANAGMMQYDAGLKVMKFCNGTAWMSMGAPKVMTTALHTATPGYVCCSPSCAGGTTQVKHRQDTWNVTPLGRTIEISASALVGAGANCGSDISMTVNGPGVGTSFQVAYTGLEASGINMAVRGANDIVLAVTPGATYSLTAIFATSMSGGSAPDSANNSASDTTVVVRDYP